MIGPRVSSTGEVFQVVVISNLLPEGLEVKLWCSDVVLGGSFSGGETNHPTKRWQL